VAILPPRRRISIPANVIAAAEAPRGALMIQRRRPRQFALSSSEKSQQQRSRSHIDMNQRTTGSPLTLKPTRSGTAREAKYSGSLCWRVGGVAQW